ncbi:MAG: YidC/Oxa1 family insertase periplasmic-domain containing protein [bacterium]|nr:YidC/Oxa1 family insertase periplasmic-domain containing protein [bacterium]MDI1337087.1 YidC/Oxa1 family insertase periplasmic-domain containing protein [Lacunisphaera sp.]
MDKKNTAIGVLLLAAAIASFYFSAKYAAPAPTTAAPAPTATARASAGTPAAGPATTTSASAAGAPAASIPAATSLSAAVTPAEYVTLANDFIEVRFTNHGGAIDRVGLKKHPAIQGHPEPYLLNAAQAAPALSFADFPGVDSHTAYTLVSQTATEVVYRAVSDSLEVTRRYSLAKTAGQDDYQIRQETVFRNLSDKSLPLPRASLNLGTAAPLNENDLGQYLNAGFSDGKDATFVARSDLQGGGILAGVGLKDGTPPAFIEKPAALVWASVKNQFFAMILTPDQPGTGIRVERVKLNPLADPLDSKAYGVTSYARFELKPLAAGASQTFGANYFTGPKEYKRLSNTDVFKQGESKVMQFDTYFFNRIFFSGFFAPLLLTIMTWVHSVVSNWGWAIVITTLFLKIVFMPFTIAASRSAKRMAKLNPLMQAMREKYKDNPQKIQTETLRLFKENKVNPLGGCIPILITIPFFVGFFAMLQSASDLRFASFLWVHDLSAPDTVAHVFGLPLNIMPLLMGATMIFQMRLTPTPTTDNAQATMMKIMPWMFTLFCYTFASGLALYSTINGLFTIGQQLIINRMPEVELPAVASDGLKNVTPKKKK